MRTVLITFCNRSCARVISPNLMPAGRNIGCSPPSTTFLSSLIASKFTAKQMKLRNQMQKLERIILINSAGFDYLDFPVGGHSQVIGVNGHGKTTLLRTVLFFYLGTNEKSPYALHETKLDFVSHYLGDPPSYLIYEVTRGDGQPAYHIAVTRPAGRIQFHFIDAPFLKDYYLDGNLVQS